MNQRAPSIVVANFARASFARASFAATGVATALLAMATLFAGTVLAQPPEADCSTPRRAVLTWLGNLQEDAYRPEVAVRCFDWDGADIERGEREALAERLKAVLDARGFFVELDDLPDNETADGKSRVYVLPNTRATEEGTTVDVTESSRVPELWLVRSGGEWLVSAESVAEIDILYRATFTVDVEGVLDQLPDWMRDKPFLGVAWWQIIGLLLLVGLGFVARVLVAWVVRNWAARLIKRRKENADESFVVKLAAPVGTLALAGVLGWGLPLLRLGVRFNQVGMSIVRVIAAVSAVIVVYRLVDLVSNVFERRAEGTDTKLDDQLVPLLRRSAKGFVVILGLLFVLQNLSVDVTSLLAIGTVGTLALSLAAKDLAANLFGSISIFTDRPFQVGDWVVVGDVEGTVEEVGMRSTRIRTFYNSLVTLPNSTITVTPVDNYGAREYRRTNVTLNLTYDTTPEQMEAFCDGVRAILQANPNVRKDYYEVHFKAFGASSLDVMLYFFFKVDSWSAELRGRHAVYLEILRLARDLKVEFAYPTQTLHVASVAEAEKVVPASVPSNDELGATVKAFGPEGERARPEPLKISSGYFATSD
ncbi:MAG: mechanosensitive ion channel family protein [Myxococcota bacterium]